MGRYYYTRIKQYFLQMKNRINSVWAGLWAALYDENFVSTQNWNTVIAVSILKRSWAIDFGFGRSTTYETLFFILPMDGSMWCNTLCVSMSSDYSCQRQTVFFCTSSTCLMVLGLVWTPVLDRWCKNENKFVTTVIIYSPVSCVRSVHW
jgi:hypothetical protein